MIQKNLMTLLHNLFAYHTHNRTKLERVLSTEHNETSEHAFNSWYKYSNYRTTHASYEHFKEGKP